MAFYLFTNFVPTLLHALFVIRVLELSFSNASTNVNCIDAERDALLEFKQDLTDPWRCLSSWTGERCCEWEGIKCSKRTGHISMINLYNCSLGGKIHPTLSDLKLLKNLDLRFNNFKGHIPIQFGNLKNLESLYLSNNLISGPISATLGQLTSLRYLELSHNNLSGNIPESIGHLSNLKFLSMGNDRLDGVVSELHFTNLTRLTTLILWSDNELIINISESWVPPFQIKYIILSSCKVGPSFPKWLRTQRNVMELMMSNCSISDEVPHWLPDILSNVQYLDLSDNMLKGNISGIIGEKTPQIVGVSLSRNNLSGNIPESIGHLSNLEILSIGSNQLDGIVNELLFANLTRLIALLLWSNNELIINISASWVPPFQLEYINLSSCKVGPEFPNWLRTQRNLLKLQMSNSGILDEAPHWLPNILSNIQYLGLSSNMIRGNISGIIGEKTPQLVALSLSRNNLSGNIPESIGHLSNLEILSIGNNQLDGVVNELHFANLTRLTDLWLQLNNELVINISASWVPPFQLEYIILSSCKVGPEFPIWLRTQRNLVDLRMSNSSISDEVPHWLPDILSNIQYLDFSGNMIRGNIFGIIGEKTPQLVGVSLSRNNLSGDISNSLCMLNQLKYLDLSKNQLSGRLPWCLGTSVVSLEWILLGDNKLNGPIPSSLCSLKHVNILSLHKNGLNAVLPECLLELDSLEILDLSDNQFIGRLPPITSRGLGIIDLERNYFTGDIPLELCELRFLHYLSLAHNLLSGDIPLCFSNFSQMWANSGFTSSLEYSWKAQSHFVVGILVTIRGTTLEFTSTLQYLFSIDLSSNALEGQIPEGLTGLVRLQNLNLSQNKLIGNIPLNIGNLRFLESLDLSNNKLSGQIPSSISSLYFLSRLDLSFNNLSGPVPSGNQLSTLEDQSIYRGNDGLCGAPVLKVCPGNESNVVSGDEYNEEDSIANWFYSGLGWGFAVTILGFCGILHVNRSWRIFYLRVVDGMIEQLSTVKMLAILWCRRAFNFSYANKM